MSLHIIGIEELARIRLEELRHDRYRPGGMDDLGLLALVAVIAGAVSRAFGWLERWATRPMIVRGELTTGRNTWHKS